MIEGRLEVSGASYDVRPARRDDVPAIVALLADDVLGRGRETSDTDLAPYLRAFDLIASHQNQELIVIERDGSIAGTLDIAVLPSLSRRGAVRVQVEAVRIAASQRGSGLGTAIFRWLIDWSRRQGYDLVQLTSDRSREDAHAFYERLGFTASHFGYKLDLRE